MKKVIGLLFIVLVTVFANSTPQNTDNSKEQLKQPSCEQIKGKKYVRRGCCSHHNGVCGCSSGRQECCDGSLSPTCTVVFKS